MFWSNQFRGAYSYATMQEKHGRCVDTKAQRLEMS